MESPTPYQHKPLWGLPRPKKFSLRTISNVSTAVFFLIGISIAFLPFFMATRRVQNFCAELVPGATVAEVQAKVAERGYELLPLGIGRARVRDPRAFGRRNCELQFDSRGLTSSEFSSHE
jgi:hypothetical protein